MTSTDLTRSPDHAGSHDRAAVPMAIVLWVIVVAALAYGVVSTASKVVALFS
ncbi:MAG TPA: hypothetical protein VFT68_03670 [Lapillicoccus sp.]|nr:hypothetical protein [Lapillicoccus sp.]